MSRRNLIALAVGSAVLVAPAASSAAMAYITTPRDTKVQGQVMVASDDGSGARAVASGEFAAISPDGTKVAYHDYGNFSQPQSRPYHRRGSQALCRNDELGMMN